MKNAYFIVTALVVVFSCKKGNDNKVNCNPTIGTLSGPYKITAISYQESSAGPEVDYFPVLFPKPCQRDNLYTFRSDGTYIVEDIGSVCSPSSADNGTWSIGVNTMIINGEPKAIEGYDCKNLVLVNSSVNKPNDRVKLTLTRQ